jgi:AAA ATPase domain
MELLERTPFLQTMADYAGEARQGSGRLVLVSGESGIGKTALLEAFQAELPDARWLWGACDGLLTPRPLGPLFDIGAQSDGELAGLCRDGAARDRLFGAFLAEIDSPAALTVAVMEDVHWADEATIDLLSFLGRRLGRAPALLVATYRDDELGDTHPLRMVLGDLATQRGTRRMRLPPLSEAGVRELVGERSVDAAELHRVTGGNPFYVREILEAGWPSVPPTVRDAIGARLARCTTPTRRAIESAAVAGSRVERSFLPWVVAGLSTSIEECLATGMVIPDGSGLRFRHELVRMAVAAGIAPYRKAELHASLVAELEARGTPTRPCWPSTPMAPGISAPCCGTPRRQPGVRPPWEHIAKQRLSMNVPCVMQKMPTSHCWRHSMRAWPTSTRSSTAGKNGNWRPGPRWRCGVS